VPSVPIGFPFKLDDEQLDQAIAGMLEPANWPGFENFANLGPELKIALSVRAERTATARAG